MDISVVQQLSSMLAAEQDAINRLSDILNAESQALSQRNLEELRSTAQAKKLALQTLHDTVQQRLTFLASQAIDASEHGFQAILTTLPHQARVSLNTQWQTLKSSFETLQQNNQQNGQIIHQSRARTQAMLKILRGQINQPNLYNQAGAAQALSDKHPIGKV